MNLTYKELKKRICDLLCVDVTDTAAGSFYSVIEPLILSTVNAVADKVALGLRCLLKEEALVFEKSAFGARALLPKNFAAARRILAGGQIFGGERLEALGDHIYFIEGEAGTHTLSYYAFAEPFSEERGDEPIPFDDFDADTVAYGAAAELCHSLYPSDMTRFVRLMTEFDTRMTRFSDRLGETSVKNTVFCGKRGVG